MGGSGGFAKGGSAVNTALKRPPDDGPSSSALRSPPPDDSAADTALKSGYAKGGAVGGDSKPRHKGVIHKGRG